VVNYIEIPGCGCNKKNKIKIRFSLCGRIKANQDEKISNLKIEHERVLHIFIVFLDLY
jgi:hypothetical protein